MMLYIEKTVQPICCAGGIKNETRRKVPVAVRNRDTDAA